MVIQCTQCDTRFRISDDKLKPGGIKVRCSKCRHIFTVMPPAPEAPAPQEEEIDFGDFNMKPAPEDESPASEPTEEEVSPSPPPPTTEPFPTASLQGKGAEFDAEEAASRTETTEVDFKETDGAQGPVEFDFEENNSNQGPAEFDFEKSDNPQGPAELDFEETGSGQGPAEFDFEETTAEQGPVEFEFEESPREENSLEFGFEEEADEGTARFSFDEEDPFAETEKDADWESETGSGAPADFDFGEEENREGEDDFDLSGMSFGEEEAPTPAREDKDDAVAVSQQPLFTEPPEESAAPAAPRAAAQEKKAAGKRSDGNRKGPLRGLLMFVLALLLVLCGVAGYFFWQNGRLDLAKVIDRVVGLGTSPAVQGQIRLSDLSGSFVSNSEAGQLFVIQGKALNDYSETRSAIAVKGALFNDKGKQLLQQTVFCGNPLSGSELRTLPFARIEEKMNNQFGDSLSNLNVEPGKAIPFTIVFKNLPADLAEYTVEAVESKAGSKP